MVLKSRDSRDSVHFVSLDRKLEWNEIIMHSLMNYFLRYSYDCLNAFKLFFQLHRVALERVIANIC